MTSPAVRSKSILTIGGKHRRSSPVEYENRIRPKNRQSEPCKALYQQAFIDRIVNGLDAQPTAGRRRLGRDIHARNEPILLLVLKIDRGPQLTLLRLGFAVLRALTCNRQRPTYPLVSTRPR